MNDSCLICVSDAYTSYEGLIRDTTFGTFVEKKLSVLKCSSCELEWLSKNLVNPEYYQSNEYFNLVQASSDSTDKQESINSWQVIFSEQHLDNGRVLEIGAGQGKHLKALSGNYEKYGIEIAQHHIKQLKDFRIKAYSSLEEVDNDFFDNIILYALIEHLEDPKSFLEQLIKKLKPGGKILISTPNNRDFLKVLPWYKSFYYRKHHLYYFNQKSLTNLLNYLGLEQIQIKHHQRFGTLNFLGWVFKRRPNGKPLEPNKPSFYKFVLDIFSLSDYIYCIAKKPKKDSYGHVR